MHRRGCIGRCTASAASKRRSPASTPPTRSRAPSTCRSARRPCRVGVCEALRPDDVVFGTYRGHALYLAKGGDLQRDGRRAVRQGDRLHQGQGRVDAPDRPRARASWARRPSSARPSPTPSATPTPCNTATVGRRRRQLLRRRRDRGGRLRREPELRRPQEPADPVRLREQRLRHPHAPEPPPGAARRSATGPRATACRPSSSTATTCSACAERAAEVVARIRAGDGPRVLRGDDLPLARARRPRPRLPPRLPRPRRRREPWHASRPGAAPGRRCSPATSGRAIEARGRRRRSPTPSPSPRPARSRSPAELTRPTSSRRTDRCRRTRHRRSRAAKRPAAARAADADAVVRRGRPRGGRPGDGARRRAWSSSASTWTTPRRSRARRAACVEKYGPERVFGTPLSEDAMTGAAIGMALAGLRPIHVHIRMDFLMLAMNQLVNVAAKSRYMYGGRVERAARRPGHDRQELGPGGAALAGAAQLLHARPRHQGGRPVDAATTPRAASLAAIRDDDPVLFVEHRLLHFQNGPVPEARLRRRRRARPASPCPGEDVTVVGISYMQVGVPAGGQRYLEDGRRPRRGDRPDLAQPARHRHHRRVGREDRPAARRRYGLDELRRGGRDRRRRGRAAAGACATCGSSGMGFAPTTCPTTPALEDAVLPRTPGPSPPPPATWSKDGRRGWLPAERADLQSIEFKGPF